VIGMFVVLNSVKCLNPPELDSCTSVSCLEPIPVAARSKVEGSAAARLLGLRVPTPPEALLDSR
jgi:hypothetical protein